LAVFTLRPTDFNKSLDELVMFMAQVAHCYPGELATFAQELTDMLQTHGPVLDKDMRMVIVKNDTNLKLKCTVIPNINVFIFLDILPSFNIVT